MESNIISFPGLGIEEFALNPVAFTIFGIDIRWYGIIITLGMIVGYLVARRNAGIEGIKSDDILDLAIYLIIFSIIGARLYYVIMKPSLFKSFFDVINIRSGGLAIYGGVGAGALTILIFSKIKKISTAKLLDAVAPGLIIGQAIGRWGNFCNAEAHGTVTDLPWRMGIYDDIYISADGVISRVCNYYHPTFLYESLWNLIGFALLMLWYRKKTFNGQIALMYITWYGFGRFFIEGLRTDSLYLFESTLGETIRVSQLVAGICFVAGTIALAVLGRKAKRRKLQTLSGEILSVDSQSAEVCDADPGATDASDSEAGTAQADTGSSGHAIDGDAAGKECENSNAPKESKNG